MFPLTWSISVGLVVPIPTEPLAFMTMAVLSGVLLDVGTVGTRK